MSKCSPKESERCWKPVFLPLSSPPHLLLFSVESFSNLCENNTSCYTTDCVCEGPQMGFMCLGAYKWAWTIAWVLVLHKRPLYFIVQPRLFRFSSKKMWLVKRHGGFGGLGGGGDDVFCWHHTWKKTSTVLGSAPSTACGDGDNAFSFPRLSTIQR